MYSLNDTMIDKQKKKKSTHSKCQKFGEIRRDKEERIRIIVSGH